MVVARGFDGTHDAFKAQLFQTCFVQIQVLEAPTHLLGGHVLTFTELLLCGANRFNLHHGNHHAAGVSQRADVLVTVFSAFAFGVHLAHSVMHRTVPSTVVNGDALVALGGLAQIDHIALGSCPPDAVDLVAWVTHSLSFTDGGRRHDPGAPQQDEVRTVLAHLQPGGFLFHARGGHRVQIQLEALFLGACLQQGDRLLAVRRVVINQSNALVLQLVLAHLLGDVLDHDVSRSPVGTQQREVPLEYRTVSRVRQAVAHGFNGHAIDKGLVGQREGNARGLGIKTRSAPVLAFHALVALHATVGGVRCFTLFVYQLDAIHTAVTFINQSQIVQLAVRPWNTQWGKGAGAVGQQGNVLFLGCYSGCTHGQHCSASTQTEHSAFQSCCHLLVLR